MADAAPRRILLVDADAFFVAVARLVDPDGAGRERFLIVGGQPGSRGVVASASYECRRYGVRSAMPVARALKLCPQAVCVPVPRRACGRKSREIAAVLARFAPVVEASSVDEWYLDLAGTERLYHDEPLAETARRIRDAVIAGTGLSVSIGGGSAKMVAKLAVELAKPKPGSAATGVYVVPHGGEAAFMEGRALAELPFVGPKFQARLERLGMRTVLDALRHDEAAMVRMLGEREGRWLYQRVRGVDPTPVGGRDEAKSISREETFARDLHDDAALRRELLQLVVRAAADLRRHGLRARTVTVKLRDADFTTRQASRTLTAPVETERAVGIVAAELLGRLRRTRRVGARLVGVALSQLVDDGGPGQLALFDDAPSEAVETERDRTLSRAVDSIRGKFGARSIVPGTLLE